MIVVRLKGGLGNQMFQYALGRALQHRRGDELRLDVTYLLGSSVFKWDVPRTYDLDVFRIQPALAYVPRLLRRARPQCVRYPEGRTLSEAEAAPPVAVPKTQTFVEEKEFGFHPEILGLTAPNLYLDGYWQSESYFSDIQDEIRGAFHFRMPLSPAGREMAQNIASVNSVCVNVRRGDYITSESSRNALGFVGEDYYRRGIDWIKANVEDPRLVVNSDDMPWCREHLKFDLPTTYLAEEYAGWKFGEQLQLMTMCKHFLISNSTFAWWAAWLASHDKKLVVCPRRWFRNQSIRSEDLIPPSWVRL
jgi:hypothetical protein